jgi:aspartyl protease family protein
MNGDQTASLVGAVMMLVLVGSGLIARRLPIAATLKMALSWVAIFGVIFVLFMFRDEAGQVWSRVKSEFSPGGVTTADGTLRVRKAEDGHFWLDTKINGRDMRLMVDSGATTTSISSSTPVAFL